jgi:hypothetical protein
MKREGETRKYQRLLVRGLLGKQTNETQDGYLLLRKSIKEKCFRNFDSHELA